MRKKIEKKNTEIADLKGTIEEMQSKIGALGGDLKVAAEGAERTRLEHESILNVEKDSYVRSKDADRSLRTNEHTRVQEKLKDNVSELKR